MESVFAALRLYLLLVAMALFGILLLALWVKGRLQHQRNPFAKRVLSYAPKGKASGIIFGKRFGPILCYSPEQAEGHIAVLGPSGKGKTSALLIPTLRSWQGTALVVDISGDISANVQVPNKIVFNPSDKDTVPYDVFAAIHAERSNVDKIERLEQLAFLLMPDPSQESEAGAFFTREGRKMLTGALICYYYESWDFVQICEFILSSDWVTLLNDIAKHDNKIANMNISSFAGSNEKNTAGCKQAMDAAIKLFATNERIKNALRKPVGFEKAISPATLEESSIFLCIDDAKLKIYASLLKIIVAQSMEYFSQRPSAHKRMILFALDEFASFGKLEIVEALRKLRKRHIRIMILTQSLADLDLIYGKNERIAMLGNFAFKVVLGCGDTDTQVFFSKLIGDKKPLLPTSIESKKDEPIIKPADLAQLDEDLIVLSDDGYTRLQKNYYFK